MLGIVAVGLPATKLHMLGSGLIRQLPAEVQVVQAHRLLIIRDVAEIVRWAVTTVV